MTDLPWWRRWKLQLRIDWTLTFGGDLTLRQWLLSPELVLVWPGKNADLSRRPESMTYVQAYAPKGGILVASYFWASASLRVLGLDVGVGFFYRKRHDRR